MYFDDKLNEEQVTQNIHAIIAAGYETSALAPCYTILMLAMHPDIQEQLFMELKSVFSTQDEQCSYEHIQQLTVLDCVIKETLRLYPPAPYIGRFTTDDVPLKTFTIPEGAMISISLASLHRVCIRYIHYLFIVMDNQITDGFIRMLISFHFYPKRTDVWGQDAKEFKPKRFLPEHSKDRHPFAFLPFAGGARNCIGKLCQK